MNNKSSDKEQHNDIISGRNPVREALRCDDKTINKILISRQAHGTAIKEIIRLAKERKIPVHHVPPERFDKFRNQNNQGIIAEVSPIQYLDLESLINKVNKKNRPFIVILDGINDPHNLGAIIRNAVAFGADGIIIGKWRSANVNETVTRTSAGAVEHISIARVPNIAESINDLKDNGYFVIGSENNSENILGKTAISFPLALVIGSEGEGLKHLTKKRCDKLISIPQTSVISSINASCASAILLYEVFKQK
jgi:23S rRNA (guanosine2251-2'-O)-methyltransferase